MLRAKTPSQMINKVLCACLSGHARQRKVVGKDNLYG